MKTPSMPQGLRAAYLSVLGPPALLAPLPLFWTRGASPFAIALYELALVLLFLRARAGRPVRLSDAVLNAIGLSYFFWLAVETAMLRPGLLRSVSHLLLFTTIAKLASLKRPGEARTALLVIFLLVLAAISSSTHVASLVYCAAMGVIGFRTLSRLAVLADFDEGPPGPRAHRGATAGLSAAALLGGVLVAGRSSFSSAPPRAVRALAGPTGRLPSTAVATDRVDLDSFGGAKQATASFCGSRSTRRGHAGAAAAARGCVHPVPQRSVDAKRARVPGSPRDWRGPAVGEEPLPAEGRLARLSVDQSFFGSGFLFCPTVVARARRARADRCSTPMALCRSPPGGRPCGTRSRSRSSPPGVPAGAPSIRRTFRPRFATTRGS